MRLIDADALLLKMNECNCGHSISDFDVTANILDAPTIEPCEDAISREYILHELNGYGADWREDCEIADIIRNAPSVVPSRPKGGWIDDGGLGRCNQCGERKEFPHWNFCPSCGVDMRGDNNEPIANE